MKNNYIDYSEPLTIAKKNLKLFEDAILHGRLDQAYEYARLVKEYIDIVNEMIDLNGAERSND